ncbi:MAG TPA: non-heme iron oxygenase ferredoxin subunit [Pirellulaceae bacterium]|nr:non-heme iron oxygenase ferredoxin subunit [Pirellulaceae bacterium]HMO90775.1 non-heme iron oxygenase ferredoxin subunit [Pirellulaceae bacterium]HMP68026.1 non-heme iron oxygenase ferredoxin subunit [Pirellulaceae bacterium]
MHDFVKAFTRQELKPGEMVSLAIDDRMVILFRSLNDEFYCIDDVCTHDGGTLSDGEIVGNEVVCPRHGARFALDSGRAMCMPATQDTLAHEVKLDGDDILVRIHEE